MEKIIQEHDHDKKLVGISVLTGKHIPKGIKEEGIKKVVKLYNCENTILLAKSLPKLKEVIEQTELKK